MMTGGSPSPSVLGELRHMVSRICLFNVILLVMIENLLSLRCLGYAQLLSTFFLANFACAVISVAPYVYHPIVYAITHS